MRAWAVGTGREFSALNNPGPISQPLCWAPKPPPKRVQESILSRSQYHFNKVSSLLKQTHTTYAATTTKTLSFGRSYERYAEAPVLPQLQQGARG